MPHEDGRLAMSCRKCGGSRRVIEGPLEGRLSTQRGDQPLQQSPFSQVFRDSVRSVPLSVPQEEPAEGGGGVPSNHCMMLTSKLDMRSFSGRRGRFVLLQYLVLRPARLVFPLETCDVNCQIADR